MYTIIIEANEQYSYCAANQKSAWQLYWMAKKYYESKFGGVQHYKPRLTMLLHGHHVDPTKGLAMPYTKDKTFVEFDVKID